MGSTHAKVVAALQAVTDHIYIKVEYWLIAERWPQACHVPGYHDLA